MNFGICTVACIDCRQAHKLVWENIEQMRFLIEKHGTCDNCGSKQIVDLKRMLDAVV